MIGYYLSAGLLLLSIYWAAMVGRYKKLLREVRQASEELIRADAELREACRRLQMELKIETTKNVSYFGLIERVCAQRDERWAMFLEHSSQHLNAQAMLEKIIDRQKQWLRRSIDVLNKYREIAEQPLIKNPDDVLEPVNISSKFRANIEKMRNDVSSPIDAVAERDLIFSGSASCEERVG